MTTLKRETSETSVRLTLNPGGAGGEISTGDEFFDHMMNTLDRYGRLGLAIEASGDMRHHLIEDVAITFGQVLRSEVPEACARYGEATIPMDDALVQAVVDLGGRAYYAGKLPSNLYRHFFYSLAQNAAMTLHVRVIRGSDKHHTVEAAMKALGLAIRQALVPAGDVFSTKGAIRLEWEEEA